MEDELINHRIRGYGHILRMNKKRILNKASNMRPKRGHSRGKSRWRCEHREMEEHGSNWGRGGAVFQMWDMKLYAFCRFSQIYTPENNKKTPQYDRPSGNRKLGFTSSLNVKILIALQLKQDTF